MGLIETGQVRGKEYNFWMELRMGKEEAKELLEREKERGGMRHQSTGFTKVILPPLKSASNSNLASEKVESRFQPLVNALEELRKGGNVRPEWTVIGTVLGNLRPRPYPNEPGALKRYVEEAEKEGLVSTGRVEGKEFGYWMKLNVSSSLSFLDAILCGKKLMSSKYTIRSTRKIRNRSLHHPSNPQHRLKYQQGFNP